MTLNIDIPDQSTLEERFSFIEDDTLRTNITITFRYIIFLIELEQKEKLPGPIIYSIYKDMIVQTGTVVESCTHYTLKKLIDDGKIKSSDVMEDEWKEEKCLVIEELSDERQVCGIIRHKATKRLNKHTNFIELNRACLKADIFTQSICEKAEKLREARNKIHLAGLNKVDDIYEKKDVDRYFEDARVILNRLEVKLTKEVT